MDGIGACSATTLFALLTHLLQLLKRFTLGLLLLLLRLLFLIIFKFLFLVFVLNFQLFLILANILRWWCILAEEERVNSHGYNREDKDESC